MRSMKVLLSVALLVALVAGETNASLKHYDANADLNTGFYPTVDADRELKKGKKMKRERREERK